MLPQFKNRSVMLTISDRRRSIVLTYFLYNYNVCWDLVRTEREQIAQVHSRYWDSGKQLKPLYGA